MKRLRIPDYVAGLGGLLLFVSLFAPWTQLSDGTEDGWRSYAVIDVLLLLVAIAAMLVPIRTAMSEDPAPAIKTAVLAAWVTLFGLILMIVKALGGLEWGGFLALAGSLVAFAGCWWAMRLEAAPGLQDPAGGSSHARPAGERSVSSTRVGSRGC